MVSSSMVAMSLTDLSRRQRTIRGKRTAMPLLCRGLWLIPSNASSKTSSASTLLTGPKLSRVWVLIHWLTSRISASVSPE